jgi:hypothetical protein
VFAQLAFGEIVRAGLVVLDAPHYFLFHVSPLENAVMDTLPRAAKRHALEAPEVPGGATAAGDCMTMA